MSNNYDRIVPYYDFLSRVVYGKSIRRAQQQLAAFVPAGSRVLIVGGGTGYILEALAAAHPAGLRISYVEASEAMLKRARGRQYGANAVDFIHTAIEAYIPAGTFDVILTAFLFDNFQQTKADALFQKLDGWLTADGRWLFADFHYDTVRSPRWQKLLLALMYAFFRLCCGIEARRLPDMARLYKIHGYRQAFRRTFFKGFIEAVVYEKG